MRFPRAFRGEEEPFGSPAPSSARRASHLPDLQRCLMDRAALVTGGSSGIGLAIATMLRAEGFALTLAARTRTKVEAAADALGAHGVAAEVANDDCRRIVDEHREQYG